MMSTARASTYFSAPLRLAQHLARIAALPTLAL